MPETDLETLERGNLYFVFRPTVEEDDPEGLADVQNFCLVTSVHGEDRYRSLIVGRKKLPEPEASGERRYWGFVDAVLEDPKEIVDELKGEEYETETRGERHKPPARVKGRLVLRP